MLSSDFCKYPELAFFENILSSCVLPKQHSVMRNQVIELMSWLWWGSLSYRTPVQMLATLLPIQLLADEPARWQEVVKSCGSLPPIQETWTTHVAIGGVATRCKVIPLSFPSWLAGT